MVLRPMPSLEAASIRRPRVYRNAVRITKDSNRLVKSSSIVNHPEQRFAPPEIVALPELVLVPTQ